MSLKQPFQQVWWSDFNSIPQALRAGTRSVIGIADNVGGLDWERLEPGRYVPRIILPHDENKPLEDGYFDALLASARMLFEANWCPITVFCWAGQHRSPAVCAAVQAYLFDEGIEGCIERVSELWPDFQSHHRNGTYAASLITKFKLRSLGNDQ
jgi:hypothetical protein